MGAPPRKHGDVLPCQARPLFARGVAALRRAARSWTSAFRPRCSTRSGRNSGATRRRCGRPRCAATMRATTNIRVAISRSWAAKKATGAARLAALAARRAGAGLVTIASTEAARRPLSSGGAGQSGQHQRCANDRLIEDRRRNAFLIGPGSGVNDRTRDAVLAALAARRALVLDADAVTVFADDPRACSRRSPARFCSRPMKGNSGVSFRTCDGGGKVERVRSAARRSGATILLKGADTVIAAPDGRASSTSTRRPRWQRPGRATCWPASPPA